MTIRGVPVRSVLGFVFLALLAIGVTFGGSVVIGFAAQEGHKPFPWEIATAAGTAVGTTLLALVTGLLALATRRDVAATRQIAELTRDVHAERHRPVLIEEGSRSIGVGHDHGTLSIRLMNVGIGPALKVEVSADYEKPEHWAGTLMVIPTKLAAISPNAAENVNLEFAMSIGAVGPQADFFKLKVTCVDRALNPVADAFVS